MKKIDGKWKLLLLLASPLFMFGLCSKETETEEPLDDYPNTDEYFTWRIPAHNGNITTPDSVVYGYYPGSRNVIVSYTSSGSANTYISYTAAQAAGGFQVDYLNVFTGGRYYVSTGLPVHIIINSFGASGQDILGTYSGTLKDSVGTQTYTVTGTFKVRNQ